MNEIIGIKLKDALKKRKISAVEFGDIIGKSAPSIYKYYNKTSFSSDELILFSKILNLPISYWFDEYANNNIINGDGSAASINGDAIVLKTENKKYQKAENEIEHLQRMVEEKERTIQILMAQLNK